MQIRIRLVIAWTLAMLLALQFVTSGVPMLNPGPATLERFAAWGYGSGITRLTGVLATTGGIMVLMPTLAAYGAGILGVVMAGAIYTQLSTGIGSVGSSMVLLVMAGVVVALRAPQAHRFGKRN